MSYYDTDLVDRLENISNVHRSLFNERRNIEWKIVFTILAFYFGIITAKLTQKITKQILINDFQFDVLIVLFMLIAIVTAFYLRDIHKANYKNKLIAQKAENAIIKILQNEEYDLKIFPPKMERRRNYVLIINKIIQFIRRERREIPDNILIMNEWECWTKWSWLWQCVILIGISIGSALLLTINQ